MPVKTPIYSYHEKEVLLHVLFTKHPEAEKHVAAAKKMEELIQGFEATDFSEILTQGELKGKKIIDLFLKDKEPQFKLLKPFYHGLGFSEAGQSRDGNALIEAGVFYTIAKLLLINYHYRKGLNKLMHAASLPKLPDEFKPLFLFRLGSIYLEQGMMVEATDTLTLARNCCHEYISDQVMQHLQELILYQMLRVYVLLEDFDKAKEVIDLLEGMAEDKENAIFLAIKGYYYRRRDKHAEAFKILEKVYSRYKDNEEERNKFSRRWFDILYQLTFCCLETGQIAKAELYCQKLENALVNPVLRNLAYYKQLQGQLELAKSGGKLDTAMKYFKEAFNLFEKYNDYRCMAWAMMNIGTVYYKQKDYTEARRCYNQSLVYNYRTRIAVHILRALLAKIDLSLELFQYDKVKEYLERIDELDIPSSHQLIPKIEDYKKILGEKQSPAKSTMGTSKTIEKIKAKAISYAKLTAPVLITGESGVGKSMIAKIIHENSGRKGEIVHLYCPSLPHDLIESGLFGYVKGAFTGATEERPGLFDKANGSTLFLDEIGDLLPELQSNLFNFFDNGTIRRVGGLENIELNVRVICATNKNLDEELRAKRFREDFYYRINKLRLYIPPFRERPEDLKKLAEYFYKTACSEHKKPYTGIEADALNYILSYHWPGNARELETVINRCVIEIEGDQLISEECLKRAMASGKQPHKEKPQVKEEPEQQHEVNKLSEVVANLTIEFNELQKRVVQLEEQRTTAPRRISNKKELLNELFLIIQQNPAIQKNEIVTQCPDLEKSFHHWVRILRDEYGVIEIEKQGNYQLYKPAAILETQAKEGKLSKDINGYYRFE